MNLLLFKVFCSFNLFVFIHAVENGEADLMNRHPYDIQKTYRHFLSSVILKNTLSSLPNEIYFENFNGNFSLELYEHLLQDSSKCVKDIIYTFESVTNISNQWSWQMLDSFAKPESGILRGNFKLVGEYNECINVYAPPKDSTPTTGDFHGQYCTLLYNLTVGNVSFPTLSLGICLPDSCSPSDLQTEIVDLLFKASGYSVSNEQQSMQPNSITCQPRERQLTAAAKCVIALISIFCAFALAGSSITAVQYFNKVLQEHKTSSLIINVSDQETIASDPQDVLIKNTESDAELLLPTDQPNKLLDSCASFLKCFCVFTNGAKLLNTDSSEGQLLCIHGIRFLSMSWVILGHAYMFGVQETRNMLDSVEILNQFLFQVVLQGFFSVDSFFVLSGFLLTYLAMMEFSKSKGSINWIYFYIHRFIRLTPIYMVILGFSATVYLYLGSGPYWPTYDTDPNCKNWWRNILYINNFWDMPDQCVGWSWYLANDMQFFVISPIFLISLWRWPKIGYSLLGLFLVACMLSNFILTYHYDMLIGLVGIGSSNAGNTVKTMAKFNDYFNKIYIKPYTRIGPYLTGIIAGYAVFRHKASNKPKLSWLKLYIGWFVASAVTLTIVYGMYKSEPSLIARSFYNACSRIGFGFGLSWVIYVCLTDQSDLVNRILSYKFFIPLSRLTYSAYLIHPMVLTGYFVAMKRPIQFSHPTVVLLYLGFMVVSYALAFPVSLILESPVVSLEKVIRSKFRREQKT